MKRYEDEQDKWGYWQGMQKADDGEWLRVTDVIALIETIHQMDQTPPYVPNQPTLRGMTPVAGEAHQTPWQICREFLDKFYP